MDNLMKRTTLFFNIFNLFGKVEGLFVGCFKQLFLVFKQYYIYFYTFFYPHTFFKKYNKIIKTILSNRLQKLQEHDINYKGQNCSTRSHL